MTTLMIFFKLTYNKNMKTKKTTIISV